MRVNIHSFFLFSTVPSFLRREINQNRVLQINVFLSMFTIDLFSKLSKREIDRIATHDDRGAPFFAGAGWLTTRLIGCCTIYATADESKRCSKKGSNSTEIYRFGYSESGLLEARGGWVENKDGTGWIRHLHTSILNKQWLPGIPFPRRTTQSRVWAHWKRVINATVLSRYRNARNESPSPSVITGTYIRSSNERENLCEFSSRPDFYHGNSKQSYIRFVPLGERIVKCIRKLLVITELGSVLSSG